MNRKILAVTGKRGGFGAIIPTIKELQRKPKVEVVLVATDQHLYHDFGSTFNEVDSWFDIRHLVPMDQDGDTHLERTKALARCMDWMGSVYQQEKPDILLVLGDRGEILTTVVAAIHFGIPIAHIQGGDVTGNIDEFIRHAITKMAHLHFPSTEASRQRIIRMGEEPWRVHEVGDTHLDMIHMGNFTQPEEVREKYGLSQEKPLILILQHSETCNSGVSHLQMQEICQAVNKFDAQKIFVYPCTDCDFAGIVDVIEAQRKKPGVKIFPNIECRDFWGLQNIASVFIGNSSAGIIETPVFHLPSVTVGERQNQRERGDNCIQVACEAEDISAAIETCLYDKEFIQKINKCDSPYGNKPACYKIAEVLSTVQIGPSLFNKRITF